MDQSGQQQPGPASSLTSTELAPWLKYHSKTLWSGPLKRSYTTGFRQRRKVLYNKEQNAFNFKSWILRANLTSNETHGILSIILPAYMCLHLQIKTFNCEIFCACIIINICRLINYARHKRVYIRQLIRCINAYI